MDSLNPTLRNPFKIEPNILCKICRLPSGIQNTLKCLVKRRERSLRPPPGLAPAAIRVVSSTFFHSKVSRSYSPLLSTKSLSNSIGGYAPYFSTDGILTSSTNIASFLPGGAPYIPFLFLSILSSIDFYVLNEEV